MPQPSPSVMVPVRLNGAVPDPSFEVEMAVYPIDAKDKPESGDWQSAVWESGRACLFIGGLEDGYYEVWVRLTTPEQTPVRHAGRIKLAA